MTCRPPDGAAEQCPHRQSRRHQRNSVTPAAAGVAYSNTPIPKQRSNNKLVPGDVFAALTNKGNYAR
jgi:hypothetical protein